LALHAKIGRVNPYWLEDEAVPRAAAIAGDGVVPKEVESALRNLGFSSQEARTGIESVDWKTTPSTQEALAVALKALGRK
jgi:Holliday junction resolvasome RuvABC DNA-binding subunit